MRAALAVVALALALPASASAALGTAPVGSFSSPTHVAGPPGDPSRVFVTEQAGTVRLVVDGTEAPAPFLDLTGLTDAAGERGLLSIAFPYDYATSGLFYVFITAQDNGRLRVIEGQRSAQNPNVADPNHLREVFAVPHADADNHNGGQLAFGPDGALYASTGDGGDQGDPATTPSGRTPCWARSCGSTCGAGRRRRRSGPWACATRGASPSTA